MRIPPLRRGIVIVLDGVGVGELPDAAAYHDQGSNTLGNTSRCVPLRIPTLVRLGLSRVVALEGVPPVARPEAAFGRMAEASAGKDSVTGHWELMGVVVDRPFPVLREGFPADLIAEFERRIGRRTLGNVVASGTEIIARLGAEHVATGSPIVYTSADSVFQVAAHEGVVPVENLYRFCDVAYDLVVDGLGMSRVIARPFAGEPGAFVRTQNRRDYARPAPSSTLLDFVSGAGMPVVGIGKIEDLFAGRGVSRAIHTPHDGAGMDAVARMMAEIQTGLIVANLVDFDSLYGHRNDPVGYARNLEQFDVRLADLLPTVKTDDLVVLTADHGNDPTTPSTDHSREYVPLLVYGPRVVSGTDLGVRTTFADVGQTLAEAFGVPPVARGISFLSAILG